MPLFFFHIRTGQDRDEDVFGVDLADLDDARRQACWAIADMMRDAALTGTALRGDALEVADEAGRTVLTVPISVPADRERAG